MTLDPREPIIRTAPRMSDLNLNGHIFGGWVLSQMDIAGGVVASRRAKNNVATVAIEGMQFHNPIMVGDLITCYAEVVKTGRTSIHTKIEVFADRRGEEKAIQVTEGIFIFVSLDENGRPKPLTN